MRRISRTLLTLLLPSMMVACAAEPAEVDSSSSSSSDDRGPIGKADAAGSCATEDGDTCGGPSDAGSCWCDDACAEYGDCCSDKATVCDDAPVDLCEDFVGPCSSDADCGEGMECVADPDTCSPSSCGCDPETGSVICTSDCGGAECVPSEPIDLCEDFVGPCGSDDDCGEGMECVADPDTCSPSACGCDPETGSVICTSDCGGSECVPADDPFDLCESFVGPCQSDDDCGEGFACEFDPDTCSPSACGCSPESGPICTSDCGGKECVPVADECDDSLDCFEQFGPPVIECVGATWECNAGTCNQTCGG